METTIVFERGAFRNFRITESTLNKAVTARRFFSASVDTRTTVFLSHSHDDLDDFKDLLGFLQQYYNVKVYIDSKDPAMPSITSKETATRIKSAINDSDKFIFLSTDRSIASKWCNWELGYGDAKKSIQNVAIFHMKEKGQNDSQYKGHEYMGLYSSIVYCGNDTVSDDGTKMAQGYYVYTINNTTIPLAQWLKK